MQQFKGIFRPMFGLSALYDEIDLDLIAFY